MTDLPVAAPEHAKRAHHPFSMSKLNYIDPAVGGCRGYKGRAFSSTAAEEGTALHEIVETVLRDYLASGRMSVPISSYAAARRTWDDDADSLLRFVFQFLDGVLRPGVRVYIELRAVIRRNDGSEVNYGHLDLFLVYPDATAKLVDWKFGYVPVLPAGLNNQGIGYTAALFQLFPGVRSIESVFVQPRLRWVTSHVFPRSTATELAVKVDELIKHATSTQAAQPMDPAALNPGSACEYCARVAECPAYLRKFGSAVQAMGGLALPTTFNLDAIDTPERAAVARAWVDFLDLASKEIKKRAEEIADINGGAIEAVVDGQTIRYEKKSRSLSRELGSALEISEALKDVVVPQQLLGAATLSLEKTLDICTPALLEVQPDLGTKKAARDHLISLLEMHGLISRPDGKIEFLKRVKTQPTKQIEE